MPADTGNALAARISCAIVLAGGLGTRLRQAVPGLPKPMAPVDGSPFLAHLVDHWIDRGVRRFVLAIGYRHETVTAYFGDHWHGAEISYAIEDRPLGTGGALALASSSVGDHRHVLVLNGDTFFDVDLHALLSAAESHDADWCLALFRCDAVGRFLGVTLEADGRIRSTDGDQYGPRLANGGTYLVHRRALLSLPVGPASLEQDLFPRFIAEGRRLYGIECAGRFIDIGTPADYVRAPDVLRPMGRTSPPSKSVVARTKGQP